MPQQRDGPDPGYGYVNPYGEPPGNKALWQLERTTGSCSVVGPKPNAGDTDLSLPGSDA